MSNLRFPLVCFDLDGTLVDDTIFIWKTLHERLRTDPVARRRAREDYYAGRISYRRWFETDLELLAAVGATEERIRAVLDELRPVPGARETLAELRRGGHKLAIISGSLDIVVHHLFGDVELDHVLINTIEFDARGRIAGGEPTPYDLEGKAEGLAELCRREGISIAEAAFVGDNSNDLWIARAAGLAIAFNCKSDELRRVCAAEVDGGDLRGVLELID
jgi:HAD superfamily phosphoserine phosphatase-like hydrolase